MSSTSGPMEIQVWRGKAIESRHAVDAVVMDAAGKVVQSFGDIERPSFARSAVKMLQALALVETGAAEHFQLSDEWLSLACGSHRGEGFHTQAVQTWLQKLKLSEAALACGAHPPADEQTMIEMYRKGLNPSKLHNNCSGKHCGMLSTSIHLGENTKGYESYDHPVQVRIRKTLSEISDMDYDRAPWGVDGCSLPTYSMPLKALAKGMTALLAASKQHSERAEAARKITAAVTRAPFMISGTAGLCSNIIKVTHGKVLAKIGAEGVYTAIIPSSGLVVALKARDGATRAAKTSLLHLLQEDLQALSSHQVQELLPFSETQIKNWAGAVVGHTDVLK